jgi:predicted nucleic acid binding AN1-type Zn finger protein
MASSGPSTAHEEHSYTAMTDIETRDATLIGSHCQFAFCNQLDFLPFRCESCHATYCLDHRTETAHQCPKAGEWAARRRRAQLSSPSSTSTGRSLLEVEKDRPCATPACKTVIGAVLNPSVHCPTCNREYCLKHRLKEDHDCANLIPIGARPTSRIDAQAENARVAFSKLKAWGSASKKKALAAAPPKKANSAAAQLIALNTLKKTAKGDDKLPPEKRVYLFVEAEASSTTSKLPKGQFFYSKDWVVGRVLDAAARSLGVENVNNQGMDEEKKLRVFHVEGGRLLEFSEKLGEAVGSGNRIVLLRGIGPAVPDLIEA